MLHRLLLLACLQVDGAPQKKAVDDVIDKMQTLMEEDDPQAAGINYGCISIRSAIFQHCHTYLDEH